jgi:hypothetical protein
VTFAWKPHCLVPVATVCDCPTATIPEANVGNCTSSLDGGLWAYSCRSEAGSFGIPVTVRFTRNDDQWTDQLTAPRRVLSSYVSNDEHALTISCAKWGNDVAAIGRRTWM